ncbi:MAG TPA: phosphatase PAP2 family protein [Longimicrobiales bacterium]|nr:phosphatase PAP2 family protein [Longimicrobiales bacterium]
MNPASIWRSTLLAVALGPLCAGAQTTDSSAARPLIREGRLFVRSAVSVVGAPLRWTSRDLGGIALGLGAIGALSLLDGEVRDLVERNQSSGLDRAARRVEVLGTITNYRALTALYVGGLLFENERARATATEALVSSVVAGALIAPTLQTIIGRSRPRAGEPVYTFRAFGGGHSLPSGHTTQAFAVASVIALEFPKPWVKAVAYGTASAVGVSRMYQGGHFLSDVVAGALLGHAVAKAAVISPAARTLRVTPVPASHGLLLNFSLPF